MKSPVAQLEVVVVVVVVVVVLVVVGASGVVGKRRDRHVKVTSMQY